MNLNQTKLTKSEWESIELPVSQEEKEILKMIQNGYNNVDIRHNATLSLLGFLKVNNSDSMDTHLFETYILPEIKTINEKYDMDEDTVKQIYSKINEIKKKTKKAAKKINKADIIRLSNSAKTLDGVRSEIFEYVLLSELEKVLALIDEERYYDALTPIYTINTLITYDVYGFNTLFKTYLSELWSILTAKVTPKSIVSRASQIFEQNPLLLKFADQTLYKHQKKLFTVMKRRGKKLVLYTAPTGTGKTMSPIGLAEGKKVIFVCAARHVGLALAKSAISVGRKIAFAFGCETADDVKLHYAAATEFVKDWKTGGIRKVDNSVGDKVEMIISDVQSYISAMYYMMAFTEDVNDIVMYWDEPTISMDYAQHDLHELIAKTWRENQIPNIVLSSATLPSESDLDVFIRDVKSNGFDIYNVTSQDFKKTISVLDVDNRVSMPHLVASSVDELKKSAKHCLTHNSIMRYLDVGEAARVILMINKNRDLILEKSGKQIAMRSNIHTILDKLVFDDVFPDINSVTLNKIKTYYCELLQHVSEEGLQVIKNICNDKNNKKHNAPRYPSTINLTTTDAYTITDGPALYLTNEVEKVAHTLLDAANISKQQMKELMHAIRMNNEINEKVSEMQKKMDDLLRKSASGGGDAGDKNEKMMERKMDKDPAVRTIMRNMENLQSMVRIVSLDDSYIPNKIRHQQKYNPNFDDAFGNHDDNGTARAMARASDVGRPFCSDIPEGVVEEIMMIDGIDDSWKILLMMGIGVFASGLNAEYVEIMKDLADTQQLFLIIASTDYIYGTNYQFCHGYLGDDLNADTLSQEKCIQALGRIGRNKLQYSYSIRFRNNDLLKKLFFEDEEKPEADNINRLFKMSATQT